MSCGEIKGVIEDSNMTFTKRSSIVIELNAVQRDSTQAVKFWYSVFVQCINISLFEVDMWSAFILKDKIGHLETDISFTLHIFSTCFVLQFQ